MNYLFKDQCVTYTSVGEAIETDTEITSDGYKVKVDGTYVTAMRGISPVAASEVDISIEDLIETPRDRWVSILPDWLTSYSPLLVVDDFVNAEIEFYQLVFNKTTGATVETLQGSVPFNNIIHGVFGNRFQKALNPQGGTDFIFLGSKFIHGKYYKIHPTVFDVISIIPLVSLSIEIRDINTGLTSTLPLVTDKINVINVQSYLYSGSAAGALKYRFAIRNSLDVVWWANFEISNFIDHRRLRSCSQEYADDSMNLLFEHPWGGLDGIGNLNVTGISVGGSRSVKRLQKPYYRRGGNASQTHIPSQSPSVFTAGRDYITAESNTGYTYEAVIYNLDFQWLGMLKASKRGFLYKNHLFNSANDTWIGIIEVVINDVSVSTERDENNDIYYIVTVQVQETVEIYS